MRSTYLGFCPSGGESFGSKCFHGAIRNQDNSLNPNCVVGVTATRCPLLTPSGTECRGANLWLRKPSGDPNTALVIDKSFPPAHTQPGPSAGGRYYLGAFYRIHVTARTSQGTGFCARPSSTEQIGCLSSIASPCSMGLASRTAADIPPAVALNVNNVPADHKHIQNLVQPDPADPGVYPFAHKLYLNTLIGFENVTNPELFSRHVSAARRHVRKQHCSAESRHPPWLCAHARNQPGQRDQIAARASTRRPAAAAPASIRASTIRLGSSRTDSLPVFESMAPPGIRVSFWWVGGIALQSVNRLWKQIRQLVSA